MTSNFEHDHHGRDEDFYEQYEQKQVLGRGLTSVVYLCVDKETGIECAAKVVEKTKLDEKGLQEIRNEIEIVRALSGHKNIINLRDVFDTPAATYIVFDLAKGGELFDQLTERVFFSEKHTRQVMRQILSGIKHIHKMGYVHRDIKPENVLMTLDDVVKIADFGITVRLAPGEKLKEPCGTLGYLAPELINCFRKHPQCEGYDFAVDMWAAGVIMYTLLVGFPPFWSSNRLMLFRMIQQGRVDFGSPFWESISSTAKDLICQLLCVDPARRLTAVQALTHPWIKAVQTGRSPRQLFRGVVYAILMLAWLKAGKLTRIKKDISVNEAPISPPSVLYEEKKFRKLIDICAFRIYSHWVKKGNNDQQNRATLFANEAPRKS